MVAQIHYNNSMHGDRKFVYTVNAESNKKQVIIDDRGAVVDLYPAFLSRKEAQELFQVLFDDIKWQHEQVEIEGQVVTPPRLVAVVGPEGMKYRYTGSIKVASGWHPAVLKVKDILKDELGQDFNFVLCNLYRDGKDSIGWHSDKEKDIVTDSTIASISLGAKREFQLENKATQEITKVPLPSGSLLLMKGKCQKLYRHAVPKDMSITKPRINLTFRWVQDGGGDGEKIEMVTEKPIETKQETAAPKSKTETTGRGRGKSRIQGRGGAIGAPVGGRGRGRGWQTKT